MLYFLEMKENENEGQQNLEDTLKEQQLRKKKIKEKFDSVNQKKERENQN